MNKKNSKGISEITSKENKFMFSLLVRKLLSGLSFRSQEIIQARFGLDSEKGKTLEEIGQIYGITRERVRQIISESIKSITKKMDEAEFKAKEEDLFFTIEKNNGIIKETDILEKFNLDGFREANAIKFFALCSSRIKIIQEKTVLEKCWIVGDQVLQKAKEVGRVAEDILFRKKSTLSDQEIAKELKKELPDYTEAEIESFLRVTTKIKQNKFGKWGMVGWPEINPKGTRDKVYLVLKEYGQPIHFTEIAKFIDKYGLGKKKAHPQTVHNELIKDDRFVLIGRGIYALAQWGYQEGTIKDVLQNILEESNCPLKREEILQKVFRIRKVKKATVLINLNDSRFFLRQRDLYSLKK